MTHALSYGMHLAELSAMMTKMRELERSPSWQRAPGATQSSYVEVETIVHCVSCAVILLRALQTMLDVAAAAVRGCESTASLANDDRTHSSSKE